MDVVREKQPNRRRPVLIGIGVVALVLATIAISRLKPAAPTVERPTLSLDSVVTGPMVREVRAPGSLVPEQIR
ncbi:MAG: RND transporter, partial [Gemmatimonadota bacterium]